MDTKVYIAWAFRTSDDANSGLMKHTNTDVFPTERNLIVEAMNAGKTTPAPTTKAGNEAGSLVMAFAILALTACVLSQSRKLSLFSIVFTLALF